ncbi:MAG: (Fe-S)-binding protein [Elusimicrobia bacterium]|nr:(Fe-S)-binding protein [Elusimicrobiota bacterium]
MAEHLEVLKTDLGERGVYDSVSQCSRCGYCLSACPTYVVTGKEAFSGRGRNQVVRMMVEGKIKKASLAEEVLSSCLLCGACTSACYAHVPTAELVLEGRRTIRGGKVHWLVRYLTWLLKDHPHLLAWQLKCVHLVRRLGISRWVALSGILRALGLKELEMAEFQVQEAPLKFLHEYLGANGQVKSKVTGWSYFTSCGPNYLYPRVGLATVDLLRKFFGEGRFIKNSCCGLPAYNYGDLESAKTMAKKNMQSFNVSLLVGDCSSCVAFLKNYDQLFLDDPVWKPKAQAFSTKVKDIIEMIPMEGLRTSDLGLRTGLVTYHDSCRARNGQGVVSAPRELFKALLGPRYVELPESEWCCGGAGAFSFTHPELSQEVLLRKISHVASTRAEVVVTSSTSCLIQLAHGLKKYYPDCRVMHLSEFVRNYAS